MGNLSTPKSVQKLQTALHEKAKAEAGYRFYALYDKISREDILAHAYVLCRSNKGAPGVDGQDFADIEGYGVQRWLGELALALRQETYRPDPIRRVFIPKANGKLRPLGISTLRDRVCMTAAMLVLEPIFEADLPPEQYAYRPGRNAQQAVVEVEALLFELKGCVKCHTGKQSLENRFSNRTLGDFAASMWNHSVKMGGTQELRSEEMRRLVGYLWSIQVFDERGSAQRGRQVFARNRCGSCHDNASSGAPKLAGTKLTPLSMVSVLWKHGPAMQQQMLKNHVPWPRFAGTEMADLIALVNSQR